MTKKLQEKLEELNAFSAWKFDEALLLLTGSTSSQIDHKKLQASPPAPDIRYLLMLKTEEMTWSIKEEQVKGRKKKKDRAGHEIYTKGNTEPVPTKLAKEFIKKGWAEDTETSVERKTRLKVGESEYQKAQDQFKLLENLKRAVLDKDIETLNDTSQLSPLEWRLKRKSVLLWAQSKWDIVHPLRHLPCGVDDALGEMIGETPLKKQTKKKKRPPAPTTDKAKNDHLRESYINEAANIFKTNPSLTGPAVLGYSSLKTLIRDSGLPKDKYPKDTSILKHWMPDARKQAGVQNKFGPKVK